MLFEEWEFVLGVCCAILVRALIQARSLRNLSAYNQKVRVHILERFFLLPSFTKCLQLSQAKREGIKRYVPAIADHTLGDSFSFVG